MASRCASLTSCKYRRLSSGDPETSTSLPIAKTLSRPSHQSLITGAAQAPASKRRTLGEYPACFIAARVTFRVKRCEA